MRMKRLQLRMRMLHRQNWAAGSLEVSSDPAAAEALNPVRENMLTARSRPLTAAARMFQARKQPRP